jgi:hypothetical protein
MISHNLSNGMQHGVGHGATLSSACSMTTFSSQFKEFRIYSPLQKFGSEDTPFLHSNFMVYRLAVKAFIT